MVIFRIYIYIQYVRAGRSLIHTALTQLWEPLDGTTSHAALLISRDDHDMLNLKERKKEKKIR